jgi:hypothetical protein
MILMLCAVWHPVGLAFPDHAAARGQPWTGPARTFAGLPPGCRVVALYGRPRGCHTLTSWPSRSRSGSWLSLRSARPARARLLRLTRSSGRPNKPPDHGLESSADQRTLFVVGQRLYLVVERCFVRWDGPQMAPIWDLERRIGACAERLCSSAVVARRTWCERKILRLTDAGRPLTGSRHVGIRCSSGGVRVQQGAARCGQNCGHTIATRPSAQMIQMSK